MYPIYYISGKEYTFLLMVVGVKLFEVLCCVPCVTFLRPERYVAFLAMLLILDVHGAIVILAQVSLASRIILDLIGNLGYIAVMNSTVGMFSETAYKDCTEKEGVRIRYSCLLQLPYFDPVRMTILDPMHNFYLGTAKSKSVD